MCLRYANDAVSATEIGDRCVHYKEEKTGKDVVVKIFERKTISLQYRKKDIKYAAMKTVRCVISIASHSELKCRSVLPEVKFQTLSLERRDQLGKLDLHSKCDNGW